MLLLLLLVVLVLVMVDTNEWLVVVSKPPPPHEVNMVPRSPAESQNGRSEAPITIFNTIQRGTLREALFILLKTTLLQSLFLKTL